MSQQQADDSGDAVVSNAVLGVVPSVFAQAL
jgi:hypothetical protein